MKTSENPGIDLILAKQRQIAAAETAAKAKERFLYEARIQAFKDTGIPAIVESIKDAKVKRSFSWNGRLYYRRKGFVGCASDWFKQTDTTVHRVSLRGKWEYWYESWSTETVREVTKYVYCDDGDKKTFKSPDELREHFLEALAVMLEPLDESV